MRRTQSNADTPTRGINRNVSNTFWFLREVLPYKKDCVVISPKPVRDGRCANHRRHRVQDELKAMLENYSESSKKLD